MGIWDGHGWGGDGGGHLLLWLPACCALCVVFSSPPAPFPWNWEQAQGAPDPVSPDRRTRHPTTTPSPSPSPLPFPPYHLHKHNGILTHDSKTKVWLGHGWRWLVGWFVSCFWLCFIDLFLPNWTPACMHVHFCLPSLCLCPCLPTLPPLPYPCHAWLYLKSVKLLLLLLLHTYLPAAFATAAACLFFTAPQGKWQDQGQDLVGEEGAFLPPGLKRKEETSLFYLLSLSRTTCNSSYPRQCSVLHVLCAFCVCVCLLYYYDVLCLPWHYY